MLKSETMVLREDLEQARATIQSTQALLQDQQAKSNAVIMTLKMQLHKAQVSVKRQRINYDRQLGEVVAHLLFLEGQVRKEKSRVQCSMKEKDEIIEKQRCQIIKLTEQNEQLLNAIREIYAQGGMNGVMRENRKNGVNSEKNGKNSKEKDKDKAFQKGRLGSMRDKLWRHRSSLELNTSDLERDYLENERQYSSQDNLHRIGMTNGTDGDSRSQCTSLSGHPWDKKDSHSTHHVTFKEDHSKQSEEENDSVLLNSSHDVNGVIDEEESAESEQTPENAGLLSVGSMPLLATLSEEVERRQFSNVKERPHSLSSVDLINISSTAENFVPDSPGDHVPQVLLSSSPTPPTSPSYIQTNANSDSNPFKTFKGMFKRRGSNKVKNKKRTVSLSQATNEQYHDALKKHFQKYDMS